MKTWKRVTLALALVVSLGVVALGQPSQPPDPIALPWGYLGFGNNELSIISTVNDPPKLRLGTTEGISSGALSFNRVISGVQRENVLFQGKQDERFRSNPLSPASEITLHLNDGSSFEDSAMVRVLEFRTDTVEILGVKFTKAELGKLKQALQ